MSTGPRTQAAFIQGNQSMMEHDAPNSALLYLFQEVSKLAPPVHHTLMDTHLAAMKPNMTCRQTPVMDREEKEAQLFGISCSSCHHTLSCLSPFKQMKKMKEEGHSSGVMDLTEPQPECNTAWKVLSLINLQCERLLSPGDVEGSDQSSSSSSSKTDHSNDNTGTRAADKIDQGEKSLNDRNPEGVSPRKVINRVGRDKSQGYTTDSQPAEKTDTFITEQEEKSETPSSENIRVWLHHQCKDCLSSKQDVLNLSTKNASVNTLLKETHADLTKPTLTLDHNANVTSDAQTDPLNSALPPSQPASHSFNSSQNQPPTDQGDKTTESKPDCAGAPNPAATEPDPSHNNTETNSSRSATSQPEPGPVPNVAPPAKQWRIKTPRKQPHPSRSADIQDPDFQGVTFRMDTELDDSKEQCRLLITSKYSRELCRSVKKPRPRTRVATKSLKTSSSDEENDPTTTYSKGKVCASCCTRKTPMWRDADDGTPLCNACGIRYKKYRVRCVNCWHIPRKESNSSSHCLKCGNFVKLTSAQRKHKT